MKNILLTGATDGIGLQTAKQLVQQGYNLVIHGRNIDKLNKVKEELLNINNVNISIYNADLSKLEEVYSMCDKIINDNVKLDVIINNAGILLTHKRVLSNEIDEHFIVNTIAPYIITNKLINNLNEGSRVINLSSAAQAEVDFNLLENGGTIESFHAYAQSKLAITMQTIILANKYDNITFVSVNPKSFLGSKMVKEAYGHDGYDLRFGSDIIIKLITGTYKTGSYYDNDNNCFTNPHPFGLDENNLNKLQTILNKYI